MNVQEFVDEAAAALKSEGTDLRDAFIEKWVPIAANAVQQLTNERNLLDLQLTEARSELEG